MFDVLKDDKIVEQVGGRFKLTVLIQQRVRELMEGSRPLIEREGRTDLAVAIEEVAQGKIAIYEAKNEPQNEGVDEAEAPV